MTQPTGPASSSSVTPQPLAACSAGGAHLPLEGVLVILALGFLMLLDVISGSPLLDRLPNSRLAFLTFVTLLIFSIAAAALRRWEKLSRVLAEWWPVLGVLVVYESLKHLHANRITEFLHIPPMDGLMLRLDQLLFGKALPLWFDGHLPSFAQQVLWFFYVWVYYLGPGLVLGYVFFFRRDYAMFLRLRRGLVFGLLGGYVFYILVPVAGPLFTIGEQFQQPILSQPELRRLVFSTLRYNWDCFPSLHTAIPLLLTLLLWPSIRWPMRIVCSLLTGGVAVACLALRFHYGVDILAGVLWASLVAFGIRWAEKKNWTFSIDLKLALRRGKPLHRKVGMLVLLFTVTGLVGLLVEQAFEKMLGTLVGASGYSSAVVLAVYFLGLTIGGAAYGRLPSGLLRHPLRLYAILEGGVALNAFLLYALFDALLPLFRPLLALGRDSFWLLQSLRFVTAACWVLPITIFMGMTFPAMVDTLGHFGIRRQGRAMTLFYGINLLGALAGTILGPYVFFAHFGIDGTLLACMCLDLAVCLTAFSLAGSVRLRSQAPPAKRASFDLGSFIHADALVLSLAAFLSGLIFFSLEVIWTHLIGAVLGNSVYAFSAMLGAVLGGLGLGSALVTATFPRKGAVSAAVPGMLFLGGALILAFAHSFWPHAPHALATWGGSLETFSQAELLRWIFAALLVLPPATAFGMVFPSIFRMEGFPDSQRGSMAGRIGAINALGCILGALVAGFVLLPGLGSEATMLLLALSAVLCGLLLAMTFLKGRKRMLLLAASALVIVFIGTRPAWDRLALTSGEQVYFARNQVFPQSQLVFFQEEVLGGITTVVANPAGVRGQPRPYLTLLTNGKFQGNDAWEADAQIGFALVPIMFSPARDNALVIGLGTGQSGHVVEAMGYRAIDVAEISPGIVAAAAACFSKINGNLLSRPNVSVHLEDGRNYLLLSDRSYDLITMEISSVWFAGSTNLYSQEFYQLAKQHLRPGGVFQQWIQLHHIGPRELGTVIATLRSVFPQVSLWVVGSQGILVASTGDQVVAARFFESLPKAAGDFGWSSEELPSRLKILLRSRLLSPRDVDAFVLARHLRLNTDRNRLLEYETPKYNTVRGNLMAENVRLLSGISSFSPATVSPESSGSLAAEARSVKAEDIAHYFGLGSRERDGSPSQ